VRRPLTAPTRRPIRLRPVRPNAGLTAAYQRRLDAEIDRMAAHVIAAIQTCYIRKPPRLAADESPAAALKATLAALARDWTARFDALAQGAGRKFARDATAAADRSFAAALKHAGFTVDFHLTPAVNDVLQATIAEQVGLIKSISAEYLTQVEGSVMRSVQVGRDLYLLSQELQDHHGVTKRRAAFIARDQNEKSTATITRARQQELGITQAIWLHSFGARHPRPTHLANNGKLYDTATGWLDPAINKRIWPGTEINCGCVSRSVIPGMGR